MLYIYLGFWALFHKACMFEMPLSENIGKSPTVPSEKSSKLPLHMLRGEKKLPPLWTLLQTFFFEYSFSDRHPTILLYFYIKIPHQYGLNTVQLFTKKHIYTKYSRIQNQTHWKNRNFLKTHTMESIPFPQ